MWSKWQEEDQEKHEIQASSTDFDMLDDVMLYDIMYEAGTRLGGAMVQLGRLAEACGDKNDAQMWANRHMMLQHERAAIDPDDRPGQIDAYKDWIIQAQEIFSLLGKTARQTGASAILHAPNRLENEAIERIWRDEIQSMVFADAEPDPHPLTVFIGGQPGAGKTHGATVAGRLNPSHTLTPIIGDDFRQYHPDYERLIRQEPVRMPKVTGHANGMWIGLAADCADQNGYSDSIEGTWRNASTVLDEAQKAKQLGRQTHALVLAMPPIVTRLRALGRFVFDSYLGGGEARWTPPEAQEKVFTSLTDSVREISTSPLIDRFTVANGAKVLFDAMDRSRQRAWRAWKDEYSRALTERERSTMRGQLSSISRLIPRLVLSDQDRESIKEETAALMTVIDDSGEGGRTD